MTLNKDVHQLSYKIWWHSNHFNDTSLLDHLKTTYQEIYPDQSINNSGNTVVGNDKVDPTEGLEFDDDGVIIHKEFIENEQRDVSSFLSNSQKFVKCILDFLLDSNLNFNHLHQDFYVVRYSKLADEFIAIQGELQSGLSAKFGNTNIHTTFRLEGLALRECNRIIRMAENGKLILLDCYPSINLREKDEIISHLNNVAKSINL